MNEIISEEEMEMREQYVILRRRKKIQAKQIAEHINCSQSLISKYERCQSNMSDDKVTQYKNYILNF